jgi:hypothetical protein
MHRRNYLIVTAALVAVCAVPGTAAAQQDLRMPDTRDAAAAAAAEEYQDLRSPDAKDAARVVPPASLGDQARTQSQPGPYTDSERKLVESPEVQGMVARASRDIRATPPVVEVRGAPSGGFDWGDAGIGAAGMLALFSIAAGSALLLVGRKRRRGVQVATR